MAPHRAALALLAAVLLVWGGLMGWALARAEPRGSVMVAVFPPGTSAEVAFAAVVAADGLIVRGTWLGSAWLVEGDHDAFAKRLRAHGAWWVGPEEPLRFAMTGGCGFGTIRAGREAERRIRD